MATASDYLQRAIKQATGHTPYAVRFPNEAHARDGVRWRLVGVPSALGLDGSIPGATHFFEVEARAPEAFGGRRMADDIVAALGEHCTHVIGRHDWLDAGPVGRSLKKQRTYAHTMTVGIDSEVPG